MTLISKEPVQRDEYGFWSHSVFNELGDEEIIPEDWFTSRGIKVTSVKFEYDAPEELQNDWFEDGAPDCSAWNPSRPEGDGWFVLSIHDTDDGPICVWARHIKATE